MSISSSEFNFSQFLRITYSFLRFAILNTSSIELQPLLLIDNNSTLNLLLALNSIRKVEINLKNKLSFIMKSFSSFSDKKHHAKSI